MNNLTILASGPILAATPPTDRDTLAVLLVQPEGLPASVLIHWPGIGTPTDLAPRRFGPAALAAIAVLDQAMKRLEEIMPGTL